MLTSLPQYISYFRALADDHVDIVDFVYGGSTRIIGRRNSEIRYPCLWLTTPVVVKKPGSEAQMFDTLVVILQGVRQDDEEEDVASAAMKVIADDIFYEMKHDSDQGLFTFGNSDVPMQPKFRSGSDNDCGWAIDGQMMLGDDGCRKPEKFNR
jgi:hypothetical protein